MTTLDLILAASGGRPLITAAELGGLVGLSEKTILNRHYAKILPIPAAKLPGGPRFHYQAVAKWLDSPDAGAPPSAAHSPEPPRRGRGRPVGSPDTKPRRRPT